MSHSVIYPDFNQFSAAIFDLDGTLVHSEHVWDIAKTEVLARYGVTCTRALFDAHVGRGLNGFLNEAFDRILTPEEHKAIGNKIGARADVLLPVLRRPVAGAVELLCALHESGMRIAICSSSPRRHIESAIELLDLQSRVEVFISGADLPRGKPDPLPYATTLAAMDLQPEMAIALEDSLSGVASAQAAGLAVLAIGEGCTTDKFKQCALQANSYVGLDLLKRL